MDIHALTCYTFSIKDSNKTDLTYEAYDVFTPHIGRKSWITVTEKAQNASFNVLSGLQSESLKKKPANGRESFRGSDFGFQSENWICTCD